MDLIKKKGVWYDKATGRQAPPDVAKQAETSYALQQVRTPAEAQQAMAPSNIGLQRNIPPIVSQVGGEEMGALVGGMLGGPAGAIIGGGLGAGLGGLASKHFPQRFGGTPEESNLRAFTIPALLGGASRGLPQAARIISLKKVQKALRDQDEAFDKLSQDTAKEVHGRVGEALRPRPSASNVLELENKTERSPFSLEPTGPIGQAETFRTRDALLGPINRMRQKYGKMLGLAYQNLKGGGSISAMEATDIADAAQGIQADLFSRAPQAQAIFKKVQSFRPPEVPNAGSIPGWSAMSDEQREAAMEKAQFNYIKADEAYSPPSLDELRELRQQVNELMRDSARGGDIHALGDFQQALDTHLMPHLPSNMQGLRGTYYQFITNYPWKDVRALRRMGTPDEMAGWMFEKRAGQAVEMVKEANPQELQSYKRLYAQRLFRNVDPNDLPEKQMHILAAGAKNDGELIKALYGASTGAEITRLVQFPGRAANAVKIWKRPEVQRAWTAAFVKAAGSARAVDQQAAEDAFNELIKSLPPEEQQQFIEGLPTQFRPPPTTNQPVLLEPPKEVVRGSLVKSANQPYQVPGGRLKWAVPWGLGSLLMGQTFGVAYGAGTLGMVGAGMATKAGYRWAVNHGVADIMSDAMLALSKGKYQESAAKTLAALSIAGMRIEHERQRMRDDATP